MVKKWTKKIMEISLPIVLVGTSSFISLDCLHEETGPMAAFVAAPRSGVAPLTVTFADQSVLGKGTSPTWSWDFGDSIGTSNLQNPTYEYTVPGTYSISMKVTTSAGNDTETKNAYITVIDAGQMSEAKIINDSTLDMIEFYMINSDGKTTDWGTNLLAGTLMPGEEQQLGLIAALDYDMLAILALPGEPESTSEWTALDMSIEAESSYEYHVSDFGISINTSSACSYGPAPSCAVEVSATPSSGTAPLTVNLQYAVTWRDECPDTITGVYWRFYNCYSNCSMMESSEHSPTVEFFEPGRYTVGLTIYAPSTERPGERMCGHFQGWDFIVVTSDFEGEDPGEGEIGGPLSSPWIRVGMGQIGNMTGRWYPPATSAIFEAPEKTHYRCSGKWFSTFYASGSYYTDLYFCNCDGGFECPFCDDCGFWSYYNNYNNKLVLNSTCSEPPARVESQVIWVNANTIKLRNINPE